MAADQIFVLILIVVCVVGVTAVEVRSRRRHKAELESAESTVELIAAEQVSAGAATPAPERRARRRKR